jgi:hypothetical protein
MLRKFRRIKHKRSCHVKQDDSSDSEDEVDIIPAPRQAFVKRNTGRWLPEFNARYPGQQLWRLQCLFATYVVTQGKEYKAAGGIEFYKACELGFDNVAAAVRAPMDFDRWLEDSRDMLKKHWKATNIRYRGLVFPTAVAYAKHRSEEREATRQTAVLRMDRQTERLARRDARDNR